MLVVVDSDAPFVRQPDFQTRLESTVDAALAYWGGSRERLGGVTLSIVDTPRVACAGKRDALGCYDGNLTITTRDPGLGTLSCIEETVLVHELGHLVIGDFDHTNSRWMEMDQVSVELAGRVGYDAGGVGACPIYLSVWRHPLGTP